MVDLRGSTCVGRLAWVDLRGSTCPTLYSIFRMLSAVYRSVRLPSFFSPSLSQK